MAEILRDNIRKADSLDGVNELILKINFEYLNEQVAVYDHTLTSILLKGKFIGTNAWGHALIETDSGVETTTSGRMRLH